MASRFEALFGAATDRYPLALPISVAVSDAEGQGDRFTASVALLGSWEEVEAALPAEGQPQLGAPSAPGAPSGGGLAAEMAALRADLAAARAAVAQAEDLRAEHAEQLVALRADLAELAEGLAGLAPPAAGVDG